jgi:tetratricopeptide (TPR) repeat protein
MNLIMKTKICIWICLLYLFSTGTAYAHPDKGLLPDAIAETEYRIVIDLDPKDTETRNKLGIVLYRKNKLKEALQQFKTVLTQRPGDFDAHDGMGLVLMKKGHYEDAVAWFKKAISINKYDENVYYHLGRAYRMMRNNEMAIEMYRKSMSLKENADILKELGELGEK